MLGIKVSQNSEGTKVTALYPSGPGELGKIVLNDEIISINGYKVNGDLGEWIEYFQDDQIELEVSRKGRIVRIICPHTNRNYYPIYKLNKVEIPSKVQKGTFRKWCGHKLAN